MYTCINNGCPDKGATTMACKMGYQGTLCAVCEAGWTKSLRDCIQCEAPSVVAISLTVGSIVVLLAALGVLLRHYHRSIDFHAIWSHAKILISFLTVVSTVDQQFGVLWPESFARALDSLRIMSLDFGVLLSASCIVQTSFTTDLLCSTLVLLAVVILLLIGCALLSSGVGQGRASAIRTQGMFIAIYILVSRLQIIALLNPESL
jgi:hypothetical protein